MEEWRCWMSSFTSEARALICEEWSSKVLVCFARLASSCTLCAVVWMSRPICAAR